VHHLKQAQLDEKWKGQYSTVTAVFVNERLRAKSLTIFWCTVLSGIHNCPPCQGEVLIWQLFSETTDNDVLIIIWLVNPQPQGGSAASAYNMIMLWLQLLYHNLAGDHNLAGETTASRRLSSFSLQHDHAVIATSLLQMWQWPISYSIGRHLDSCTYAVYSTNGERA